MADRLTYRVAGADDVAAAARIAGHSFPGAPRTPEWWDAQLRDPRFGGGTDALLLGEAGGELVAACQVHPLRQWIGGERLPVAGVGTVSVSPARRRQGFAAELVGAALRFGRERGDVASALYPFRTSFYRHMGYGDAGVVLQYLVATSALPDAPERSGVELLAGDDAEALRLYGEWAATQTGQLERTDRAWRELAAEPERALFGYRAPGGALEGYASVRYRAELPRPQRYLEVDELVWTTPGARRGLHALLASLADQWHQLLLRALPSHRLGDWLDEARLPPGSAPSWNLWTPAATLLAGPMFRILDVARAFSLRRVAAGPAFALTVEVRDRQLAENAGAWTLSLEGGRIAVARGTATANLRLALDISTLSRLYVSALSATAAHAAGLLECDHPERLAALDAALALPEPWTFDRF